MLYGNLSDNVTEEALSLLWLLQERDKQYEPGKRWTYRQEEKDKAPFQELWRLGLVEPTTGGRYRGWTLTRLYRSQQEAIRRQIDLWRAARTVELASTSVQHQRPSLALSSSLPIVL